MDQSLPKCLTFFNRESGWIDILIQKKIHLIKSLTLYCVHVLGARIGSNAMQGLYLAISLKWDLKGITMSGRAMVKVVTMLVILERLVILPGKQSKQHIYQFRLMHTSIIQMQM
ncbi:unnamed protein product [Thlaspi arvense]|uniref:Uncharacterized protein n=1 Tax=Thlaspi arvense TaxID=13288 RepID=A0AAU9SL80_THLAR|nr:unnamed protein product [Thlaspi arvense]